MKRNIFAVLLVTLLVAALMPMTGLAQESATVRYFTFSAAPDYLEELDMIIAAFEEANPGITIEVATAPYDDYFTLLEADFVGGDAPDVFELNYESFVSYAANGVLLDLSDYMSDDAPYYPRALESFQYEGMQYALPATFSTVLLFYNMDLFDQAGIEYPTPDWTWDDAIAAGEAITALGPDIWGLYSPIQFWEFYKKAGQNNCQFFNEDMTESTINSPECLETLETMIRFLNNDVMPDPIEEAGISNEEYFINGQLGMDVIGIWMFGAFADVPFAWDIQLEPGMAQQGHHFFANGVAVAQTTDVPEAAAKWAEFLTASETAANVRVEAGWELPALNEPAYFDAYLAQGNPANRAAVFQALESPVVPPVIERQAEMQDAVNEVLSAVAIGELEPQAALDLLKEQLDALVQ